MMYYDWRSAAKKDSTAKFAKDAKRIESRIPRMGRMSQVSMEKFRVIRLIRVICDETLLYRIYKNAKIFEDDCRTYGDSHQGSRELDRDIRDIHVH